MALEEEFGIDGARGGARGHRDRRPGLRPRRRQALMRRARGRRASRSPASASSRRAASARTRSGTGLLGPGITERRAARRRTWIPTPCFDNPKEARRADRFAAVRARRGRRGARAGRRRSTPTPAALGVDLRTGVGGLHTLEEQIVVLHREGRAAGLAVPRADDDGQRRRRRRSRCATAGRARARRSCTACAAGTHAIGNAARLIAWGRCDAVLTGGTEAAMTADRASPGFGNMTALSTLGRLAAVRRRARRLRDRRGRRRARARGVGAAVGRGAPRSSARSSARRSTADAHHITAPSPGGAGAIACMELALADAGLDAGRHRARSTPTARRRR